ncbi:MAG: STAS domain-containing protein [Chloroflexi bacterium]|nr:STAS domain-containing protein [Chloroflexota bacterium]MBP8057820.1 STAS domain-containing protein [Chloroflexota bacterium]
MADKNTPFRATVQQVETTATLVMHGEINNLADESLAAAYTTAEQHNPAHIVLDFTHVDYINSTGIALIVGLLARARASRRALAAIGLSDHYREIFTITRLSDFMDIR